MIFLFIHLDSELRSAFLVENEFDYALTEFNTHYLIGDGLSNQLPFEQRFSVIIGNPPFGGNANLEAMQWLPDVALSKMNLAKLFLFRSLDLAIPGGIICFLMPKAITYTSDWKSIRNATSPFIWCLIDIKQAFEGVLLEQVIVTLKNQVPNEMCRISGSLSMTKAIWVKKSMFQDTWNCDLSKQDIILLQSILIENKITKHLRNFSWVSFTEICFNDSFRSIVSCCQSFLEKKFNYLNLNHYAAQWILTKYLKKFRCF